MRRLILILAIIIMISFISNAQESSPQDLGSPGPNFEKDPAGAFSSNPEKAWGAIEQNPTLMKNENVLDAAFKNDNTRAADILDKNPSLLFYTKVADRYDKESISNVNLLNDNPQASRVLLSTKYKINNEGSLIYSYDGKFVGTGDPKRSVPVERFAVNDFPGATITKEGVLVLDNKKELHSGTAYKDDKGDIIAERGFLKIGPDVYMPETTLSNYQNTVKCSDNCFFYVYEKSGDKVYPAVYRFSEGYVTREGDSFVVGAGTKLTKYIPDDQGNTLTFGLVTAEKPMLLSQVFENCKIGTDCVTLDQNGPGAKVSISQQNAIVISKTSYTLPITKENGPLVQVPQAADMSVSTQTGKTSLDFDGKVSYCESYCKVVGFEYNALQRLNMESSQQVDEPALVKKMKEYGSPYGMKVGEGFVDFYFKPPTTDETTKKRNTEWLIKYTFVLK